MRPRSERGQTTAEILGALVVVVALVAALVAGHPGRLIGTGMVHHPRADPPALAGMDVRSKDDALVAALTGA